MACGAAGCLAGMGAGCVCLVDPGTVGPADVAGSPLLRACDEGMPLAEAAARRTCDASVRSIECAGMEASLPRLGSGFVSGFDAVVCATASAVEAESAAWCSAAAGVPLVACTTVGADRIRIEEAPSGCPGWGVGACRPVEAHLAAMAAGRIAESIVRALGGPGGFGRTMTIDPYRGTVESDCIIGSGSPGIPVTVIAQRGDSVGRLLRRARAAGWAGPAELDLEASCLPHLEGTLDLSDRETTDADRATIASMPPDHAYAVRGSGRLLRIRFEE